MWGCTTPRDCLHDWQDYVNYVNRFHLCRLRLYDTKHYTDWEFQAQLSAAPWSATVILLHSYYASLLSHLNTSLGNTVIQIWSGWILLHKANTRMWTLCHLHPLLTCYRVRQELTFLDWLDTQMTFRLLAHSSSTVASPASEESASSSSSLSRSVGN